MVTDPQLKKQISILNTENIPEALKIQNRLIWRREVIKWANQIINLAGTPPDGDPKRVISGR